MQLKKIFCSIILVLSMTLLMGCANVEYQRRVDDLGQILDKITVELDYDDLKSKGVTDSKIHNLLDTVKDELQLNYVNVLESNLSFLQASNPVLYNAIRSKVELNPVLKIADEKQKIYKVSAEVLFKNATNYTASEIMQIVYGIESNDGENEEAEDLEVREDDFLTKYVQKSSNVFGDVTKVTLGGVNLYEKYHALCPEFTDEDVTLTQIYGSTNHRLKSNAQVVETIEGFKCHLWEMNIAQAKDFELEFYYLSPTTSSWYILALCLSVGLVIVLVTIYVVVKNKDKFRPKKVLKEEEIQDTEE